MSKRGEEKMGWRWRKGDTEGDTKTGRERTAERGERERKRGGRVESGGRGFVKEGVTEAE